MVARTVAALTRLLDVVTLLRADTRVQVRFTDDPDNPAHFSTGTRELLESLEVDLLPWNQVLEECFDLVLTASENDRIEHVRAPVLLFPHGLGFQKYYPGSETVAGMNPHRLVHRGEVLPSLIALSHGQQRRELAAACPAAAEHSAVLGDPCVDRLLESRHLAEEYRSALGASGARLVVLASTWGSHSLFGTAPWLAERLLEELPLDEYRVALVLHLGVWSAHSPWQIRTWLARARACGLRLLPPQEGWRAAVTAAACVISDEGSVALYAAAADKPLLLAGTPSASTVPGTPLAALAAKTPSLDFHAPLREQVDQAVREHAPGEHEAIASSAVAHSGESAPRIRKALYRTLELPEPAADPVFPPVPPPGPEYSTPAVLVAGGTLSAARAALTRHPATDAGRAPHEHLDHRHLVADVHRADRRHLESASVLLLRLEPGGTEQFDGVARSALARWPHADTAAAAVDGTTCLVAVRGGPTVTMALHGQAPAPDPLVLASLVHVRMRRDGTLPARDELHLGERVLHVTVAPAETGSTP
ncbi:hypothetical protein [Salinifilum ghardaiensis]